MTKRKKAIINPNAITQAEQEFIKEGAGIPAVEKVEQTVMKSLSKQYLLQMGLLFNTFLKISRQIIN